MKKWLNDLDRGIVNWSKEHGYKILRYSLAVVFIWFGALKPFGLSPATELAGNTVYWFDPSWFVPFLGLWEVAIGVCLLHKPLARIGLILMSVQMIGTFFPLVILPEVVWTTFPHVLTLEGQYIIKNIVLIAAGMVVTAHLRDRKK